MLQRACCKGGAGNKRENLKKRKNLSGVIALVLMFMAGSALIRQSNKVEGATMNAQASNNATEQKKSAQNPGFACNMLALNAEERNRHVEVTKRLRAATKEERELPDGYEFRFSPDQPTILLVSEFIAHERLCCPFFTF